MKTLAKMHTVLLLLLVPGSMLLSQVTGDYRSVATGNWSSNSTWQRYNGTAWVAATTPPTGTGTITVQTADSVYINSAVTITGTLANQGRLGGTSNLTIGNNGTYQHDQDAGSIPVATWGVLSKLLLTGSSATAPDNKNQDFYHVEFNTPNLLSNLNMAWNNNTIRGNITIINTGSSRWQMTGPAANDSAITTISGDIIQTGGNFSSNGTSNAFSKVIIHQYGNVNVTGGNFSVSRGSQGSGTGSTRWYIHNGNFSMSNATTQNSNPTNAWFVFDKQGTQTLTLGSGNTLTALPIEVASGTTLDMGLSEVRGSGLFMLDAGATLATAHTGGVAGAVTVTGAVTMDPGASFTFNGTAAQVTSTAMPATVQNLWINNAAGVTLSQATTINGVLRLMAGVFNNTIPFTLGPSGSISYEGGSLLIPVVSVDEDGETIPQTFFVDQNFPNPFNPTTQVRFGLPTASEVTVKVYNLLGQEVASVFEGRKEAGVHEVEFDASHMGSGVYLYRVQAGNSVSVKKMTLIK